MLRWRSPTGYDASFGRTGKSSPITSAKLVGVGAASQRLIWKREQSTRGRPLFGGVVREPMKTHGQWQRCHFAAWLYNDKENYSNHSEPSHFKADATYSFRLKSKAAEVTACGVTIENGAEFVLTGPNHKLPAGSTATVIKIPRRPRSAAPLPTFRMAQPSRAVITLSKSVTNAAMGTTSP